MNTRLTILIALSVAFPGAAFAQYEASATPLVPAVEAAEITDLATLKSQPLPIRRKIVASQLASINVRLTALYDKTALTATRLAENGIDVSSASSELALTAAALKSATLSIETLTTVANDPANTDVVSLMIDGASFKDVVIKTEADLRSAREHIIGALSLLKIAVISVATQ